MTRERKAKQRWADALQEEMPLRKRKLYVERLKDVKFKGKDGER